MAEKKETAEKKAAADASVPSKKQEDVKSASATLTEGRGGILGVKAGMTQVYNTDGQVRAVTVIELKKNTITQKKTVANDGYTSVQVGFLEKKDSKALKPEKGHVKKSGGQAFYHYQELRTPKNAKLEGVEVGSAIDASFLKEGDLVDLTSVSKGKGMQGVMKRYHFRGGPATHGASIVHRMPGSIGQRTDPGKVWKGKKMAGHMGNKKVTIQNIEIVKIDLEKNILLVNGSVPGPRSGIVTVRRAVKGLEQAGLK